MLRLREISRQAYLFEPLSCFICPSRPMLWIAATAAGSIMAPNVDQTLRCCKKTFATSSALRQHRADSQRHALDENTLPQTASQRLEQQAILKCSCGKRFKAQAHMDQHQRDSPMHRGPTESGATASTLDQQTFNPLPEGHPALDLSRHAMPIKMIATPFMSRTGTKVDQSEARQKQRSSRHFELAFQGAELWSGSGNWYQDVGDDHGLCDKDCGWCGHCADEARI
ncbi:hypothetical protein B0J15DRAFT_501491 [Fusarium solani]|uniref:C2H2-type domain-containing protein n=1 Tax=Fusarium solani TaxID=169388 RepID=A0A9P9K0U4_FUSSL|nr:uncharacterized protein B0J15DRAFT_501491 [Fusarium solani]KAH7243988.1 hypothetical protein B0J15DRAFT_501491 [Fusarium solani]